MQFSHQPTAPVMLIYIPPSTLLINPERKGELTPRKHLSLSFPKVLIGKTTMSAQVLILIHSKYWDALLSVLCRLSLMTCLERRLFAQDISRAAQGLAVERAVSLGDGSLCQAEPLKLGSGWEPPPPLHDTSHDLCSLALQSRCQSGVGSP